MLQFTLRRDKPVAIILGIIFFLSGVYTVLQPEMTMLAITYLIAGLLILRGLISIVIHFVQKRRRSKQRVLVEKVPVNQGVKGQANAENAAYASGASQETTTQTAVVHEDSTWMDSSQLAFGIILILLGVLFLTRLDFTTILVTYFISFYFLADAIFAFIYGVRKKSKLALVFLFLSFILFGAALLLLFGGDPAILPTYIVVGVALMADGINTGLAPFAK